MGPAVLLVSIMSSALQVVALLALMALFTPRAADAHGRLINPASRGSAFRFGFKNPSDWNDNAGVCGGHSNQKNHVANVECVETQCRDHWHMRLVVNLPTVSSQRLTLKDRKLTLLWNSQQTTEAGSNFRYVDQ